MCIYVITKEGAVRDFPATPYSGLLYSEQPSVLCQQVISTVLPTRDRKKDWPYTIMLKFLSDLKPRVGSRLAFRFACKSLCVDEHQNDLDM